ncbi:MAG: hypothetical protein ACLQFW_08330 [Xanthobacteraceae bacterium]
MPGWLVTLQPESVAALRPKIIPGAHTALLAEKQNTTSHGKFLLHFRYRAERSTVKQENVLGS